MKTLLHCSSLTISCGCSTREFCSSVEVDLENQVADKVELLSSSFILSSFIVLSMSLPIPSLISSYSSSFLVFFLIFLLCSFALLLFVFVYLMQISSDLFSTALRHTGASSSSISQRHHHKNPSVNFVKKPCCVKMFATSLVRRSAALLSRSLTLPPPALQGKQMLQVCPQTPLIAIMKVQVQKCGDLFRPRGVSFTFI